MKKASDRILLPLDYRTVDREQIWMLGKWEWAKSGDKTNHQQKRDAMGFHGNTMELYLMVYNIIYIYIILYYNCIYIYMTYIYIYTVKHIRYIHPPKWQMCLAKMRFLCIKSVGWQKKQGVHQQLMEDLFGFEYSRWDTSRGYSNSYEFGGWFGLLCSQASDWDWGPSDGYIFSGGWFGGSTSDDKKDLGMIWVCLEMGYFPRPMAMEPC